MHTVRRRWAGDNFESSLENVIVLFFSAVSLHIPHTLKKIVTGHQGCRMIFIPNSQNMPGIC